MESRSLDLSTGFSAQITDTNQGLSAVHHTCDLIRLEMERERSKRRQEQQEVVQKTHDMIAAAAKETGETMQLCQNGLEGLVEVISNMQRGYSLGPAVPPPITEPLIDDAESNSVFFE